MTNSKDQANLETICEVCGGRYFKFFLSKNGFNLYRCEKCDLRFVFPIPKAAEIYSEDYFSGGKKGFGYADYDQDKAAMDDILHRYLDLTEKYIPARGKLLDVGAATGYFLKTAQKRGWSAEGIEISDFAAESGRQKGLLISTGTLETIAMPPASFDAVTMLDVIEHLESPRANLKRIRGLLNQGGLVVINAPDAGSLAAKFLGKKWHLIFPPEHIFYFNKNNLTQLLKSEGFKVLLAAAVRKQFNLRYAAQTFSHTHPSTFFKFLSKMTANPIIGNIKVPSLKDNLFIIAQKI